ncbi:MAG: hypothetical protein AB7P40_29425 [Chloroflexota bacterium]
MRAQITRLWQFKRGRAADGVPNEAAPTGDLALPDPARADAVEIEGPEQPVLLTAAGTARPVHVGELLPARRRAWPLSVVRLPVVPKRAILAAGVCAGLAAPGLARHLATRLLLGGGRPGIRPEGVLEVTRIVYNGPLTPQAAAAIGKALAAGRR